MRALNGHWHKPALYLFLALVIGHWVEHLLQAYQVYALGWSLAEAHGGLGLLWPWLSTSEVLHVGYAGVMLLGLYLLRFSFSGSARLWWDVALWIQVWHQFEHLVLLVQALSGWHLAGRAIPTSVVQLVVPRVELHLFYNAVVFLPTVVGMLLHVWPPAHALSDPCSCSRRLDDRPAPA